jgi:hypothetical protein
MGSAVEFAKRNQAEQIVRLAGATRQARRSIAANFERRGGRAY